MPSPLTYRDSDHAYFLNGERVPSVTTCTGVLNKPALVGWGAQLGAEWARDNPQLADQLDPADWAKLARAAPTKARDSASRIGSDLHTHAERLAKTGEAPDVPATDLAMVLQAADFLDAMGVDTLASERAIYHDTFLYAGRFDLVAQISGAVWLLDFKTGKSGVWPEMALQQSAYRFATHMQGPTPDSPDAPMPPIAHVGIVWVRPEGWELVPVRADRDTWQAFLACIPIYQFLRRRDIVLAPVAAGKATTDEQPDT
jgi:hypothetical protein